jgi:hypothetical protein
VQWDKVEDKNSVIIIGVGAVVLLWFSSSLVTAINGIPLVRYNADFAVCSAGGSCTASNLYAGSCTCWPA